MGSDQFNIMFIRTVIFLPLKMESKPLAHFRLWVPTFIFGPDLPDRPSKNRRSQAAAYALLECNFKGS
jgi:hypothetical protein